MHRLGRAATAATTFLALGLITACAAGTGESASADADTIVLQTNWTSAGTESKPLHAALDVFTDETGIEVKVLENGDDLNQVYETSLLAGEEADVLLVGLLEKQLDWVKNGAVVPLEDRIDEWGLTEVLPPQAVEDWTDGEGHLRGLPYAGFTWPWWYNTAVFEAAGVPVPETTDDLVAAVEALRAAGYEGVATGGNDWSGQKLFLQFLQTYLDPDEARTVFAEGGLCDNPDAMKGVELFVSLRDAGVFVDGVEGLTSDQATAMYQTGKAAISPMGSWTYTSTDDALAATTLLSGMPVVPGGTYDKPIAYAGSTSAGWWVSPNGEKKIDAVSKLLKFMYRPETLELMVDGGVDLSTAADVDVSGVSIPLLAQSLSDLPERVDWAVMPDLHVPADVSNPMYRATSIAFTQGNDAQKICATVDDVYAASGH